MRRRLGVVAMLLIVLGAGPRAQEPPQLLSATVTSAYWYGAEAIPSPSWVLIHPASASVRIGGLTGDILFYAPGQALIAQMPTGRLTLHLAIGAWDYVGSEGAAVGTLEAP